MPYINLVDRQKFKPMIDQMMSVLGGGESDWIKGEMFGHFVIRMAFGFMDHVVNASFNSNSFTSGNLKTINSVADKIAIELRAGNDPFGNAGNLNYVVSAIYWGVSGKATGFPEASYAMRAYLRGTIEHVICKIQSAYEKGGSATTGSPVMAFRRHLLICGVLSDVISESYHINTRPYEDMKRRMTGDLWNRGVLNIGEVDTRQPHEKLLRP
jgi:hypothetical protein